jgi:hypothetical protein
MSIEIKMDLAHNPKLKLKNTTMLLMLWNRNKQKLLQGKYYWCLWNQPQIQKQHNSPKGVIVIC